MFDLKEELKSYIPFDEKEAKNVYQTIKFLEKYGDMQQACSRGNSEGHFTGSGLIIDKNGRVLLNHHKKADIWIQFGGHCEQETDVFEVALRETCEEAGFKRTDLKLLNAGIFDCAVYDIPANRTKGEPAHKHYDINFLFLTENCDYKPSKESLELRWCDLNEANRLINGDVALTRMFKKVNNIMADLKEQGKFAKC